VPKLLSPSKSRKAGYTVHSLRRMTGLIQRRRSC